MVQHQKGKDKIRIFFINWPKHNGLDFCLNERVKDVNLDVVVSNPLNKIIRDIDKIIFDILLIV